MNLDGRTARRVLVVEDDPDYAVLLATYLSEEGFETTVALDGEDALRKVLERRPDLVTLDLQMPRKSGMLFYRQMRSHDSLCNVPVVVVSGLLANDRDQDVVIRSFMVPPPQAYLDKPVHRRQLVDMARSVLGGHRPARVG